ncbi:MAG: CoA transferase, partial [Alphaproteobacteria bacterium]
NFRPGTLEKMGYGPDALHKLNPKLIIIRVSGWGQDGPYRHKPGFGTLVEAMTGFAAMNGYGDRPPVLPPLAMADMIAGITGAFAAMVALREAERDGGKGQVIDLPLFDPMLGILGPQAADYKVTGDVTPREGSAWQRSAPRNVYETSDGGFVSLSASMQGMCEQLFKAMGREELIHDMRFRTNSDRVQNRDELDAIIQNWMRQRPRDEILEFFDKQGITVGPVSDIAELMDHPFIKGRGIIEEYPDDEMEAVPMHAVTPRLSATPGAIRSPAPKLGEHNAELLKELGYDAKAQAKLKDQGAI